MKNIKIIIIAIVVLLIFVSLFVANRDDSTTEEAITNTGIDNSKYAQLEFPENDLDTSDWKTYRNEEFGFEVRYPGDWGIDFFDTGNSTFDGSGGNQPKTGSLALFPSNIRNIDNQIYVLGFRNLSLENEIKSLENDELFPEAGVNRYVKVNNTFGIETNDFEGPGFYVYKRYILAGKNKTTYEFRGLNEPNASKYQLELEQILLSFKLIQ